MFVLGIESSCDETAAAVVEDGRFLHANIVATQMDIHAKYGGVVPEIAARSHIETILPVIDDALETAFGSKDSWNKVDAIAVTNGPGLSGSLLVGTLTARTIAQSKNIPLYPVNHVLGHVYANFIEPDDNPNWQPPAFPLLALIVSGGHSQLVLFKDHFNYELLGQTQDDAIGEAFDKVAKILGLPYPGGPSIEKAAKLGDAYKYDFPKARMPGQYDFSFSGPKTAVLRRVQSICGKDYTFPSFELAALLSESQRNDVAASFQRIALETVVDKTVEAFKQYKPASVVIAGGVAASSALRELLSSKISIEINYAKPNLCTDNGAMIATLGYYSSLHHEASDPSQVEIHPNLKM